MGKLKLIITGVIAGVFTWLLVLLKLRTKQRDAVQVKQQETEKELVTVVKVQQQNKDIEQAVQAVRQQAKEIQNENFENRNTPPSGNFGDKRLR